MTASPAQTASRPSSAPLGNEIEASCRVPIIALFGGALLWLFVGVIFDLIASLKFHAPNLLASQPYFTYGRVHAAQTSALLYGFGLPAALGVGLWLLCRLGRTPLVGPAVVFIGTVFWNSAVAIGLAAILCGGQTGYESFQMPEFVSVILFFSYLLIALCGMMTFSRRAEGQDYPSVWFVLGSFFWFPWIFSTAVALLLCMPARGVVQASIDWWYAHNLSSICLGFAGLGSIFYFIPKLMNRPLHSYYLAALAFWTLALFGSWAAIPAGAPLPAWIISLGFVGTLLTAVPLLAVALNICQTVRHNVHGLDDQVTLRFSYIAMIFWFIAGFQQIVGVIPGVSMITNYTWFPVAHWELFHYGFFAFAMFGAMYYVVPRLLNRENPPAWRMGLVKAHFVLTLAGVLISYIALFVSGVGEGYMVNSPQNSFADVMRVTLIPLRGTALGDLFIFIGTVAFLLNFTLLLARNCCWCAADKAVARKERV